MDFLKDKHMPAQIRERDLVIRLLWLMRFNDKGTEFITKRQFIYLMCKWGDIKRFFMGR